MRPSGRNPDELRAVSFERGFTKHAEGSCLVRFGDTHVLCTASLEERVPPWLKGGGKGWVTAEYGMLPRATARAHAPRGGGRQAIRPHPGNPAPRRPLACAPWSTWWRLGERQITLDCDVHPGRWRHPHRRHHRLVGRAASTASSGWSSASMFKTWPLKDHVAAISCGIHGGTPVLDLDYAEDFDRRHRRQFRDDGIGRHRRDPGHGRGRAVLRRTTCMKLMALARKGIDELVAKQKDAISDEGDADTRNCPLCAMTSTAMRALL